jgi:polyhydroxyalkanoate synthase
MNAARRLRQANAVVRNARDRFLRPSALVRTADTPYVKLHDNGLVKLRYYAPAPGVSPVSTPLVIVPPLAINMLIYDLLPERSFVRYMTGLGFPVYMIDWGSPRVDQAHFTLSTYVKRLMPEFLGKVRQHAGTETLSLQGWSMGGGLCLAYISYHNDSNICNLVTFGTGIDGHANGVIGKQYRQLAGTLKRLRLDFRKVPARMAYSPAWLNVVGFKLSDPKGSLRGYRELLANLADRDYVVQHATQSAFIDNLEAYPGGVIRDWMSSVWLENETSRGRLTLGREHADFARVTANLLAIAGQGDTLANVDCCRPILSVVGSVDKEFFVGPGGHTGIMSGSQAPETTWKKAGEWLLARS